MWAKRSGICARLFKFRSVDFQVFAVQPQSSSSFTKDFAKSNDVDGKVKVFNCPFSKLIFEDFDGEVVGDHSAFRLSISYQKLSLNSLIGLQSISLLKGVLFLLYFSFII